jgi:secreted trypsin-like serine protease
MRVSSLIITTLSILVFAACSQNTGSNSSNLESNQTAGIYGGDVVATNDSINQSIVGLYSTDKGYLCTGSIITNDLILTAAHCVQGDTTKIKVLFGGKLIDGNKLGAGVVVRDSVKGEAYPGFDINHITETGMNDVGLVRFSGGLPAGYKPATLLVNYAAHIHDGTTVVMAGYGISNVLFKSGAGTLRKVTLQVDNANLSSSEASIDQGVRKGICEGDSGGPSYLQADGKYLLWGITSRGAGLFTLAPCIFSSTYTRIDAFWPWFQKAAVELGSSLPDYPATQK